MLPAEGLRQAALKLAVSKTEFIGVNRLGSNILSVCRADIDVAQERVAGDFGGVA